MGMSSSQARLLTLTARMHDIEYRAQRLEAQKLQMANESRRAYESYLEAIDATKIQYKGINGDGSITFRDATLRTLENGAIPNYEGEASYKPYLLKNGMTDEIYVTPEFAAAFGIEDPENLPPLGTLEQWLEEYPGLNRAGSFIENIITPPVDPHTEYTNSISGNVTAPEMTKLVYTGVPTSLNMNQYTGWNMADIGGVLPTDWVNAGGYSEYNLNDGAPYDVAKRNNGLFKDIGSNYQNIKQTGSSEKYTYDFALSNQYTSYSFGLLEGLAVGVCKNGGSLGGYLRENTSAYEAVTSGNGHLTCVIDDQPLATFMYYAIQIMSDILNEYGTDSSVTDHDSTAYKTVKDFYDVLMITSTRDKDKPATDLLNALVEFCNTHYKKDGQTFAQAYGITGNSFPESPSSYVSVFDNTPLTNQAKKSFFNGQDAKNYGVANNYTREDVITLIKIGLMEAGQTAEQADSLISGLNDWKLYSALCNYNDPSAWEECISKIIAGNYRPSGAPDNFELIGNANENKISLSGTETVSDPTSADTINFDYTQDSYRQQVLYDICKTNNRIDKNDYTSPVSALSQEELASLMVLKFNDPSAYNIILQRIMDGEDMDTIKADLQSCAGKTINWGTQSVEFNQTSNSVGKGKIEIPKLETLASNIYVAMRQKGMEADESEILAYLINNYNDINDENNMILTYINDVICGTYVPDSSGAGLTTILEKIAGNNRVGYTDVGVVYINGHLSSDYDTTRNITGRASEDWVHDEIYEQAVREYNQQKALRESKFKIIRDEELLNSTEFLSNWLTLNEGYLLEFDPETFGMVDTNVAVTTHLQEVSDERNLKKAEAQYEADMKRIDMKDRRYDTQLAALDTERNAIKLEMETVKTVAKDNVDRTFRLFS